MLEIMTNEAESSAKIIVIGVGGAGNNAVNRGSGVNICKFAESEQKGCGCETGSREWDMVFFL